MVSKSLTWNGEAVSKKWKDAQIVGVNATMGAAVGHAKNNHKWVTRTGVLEGGITLVDYAKATPTGVEGTWGVHDVIYARIHELGGVIKAKDGGSLQIPDGEGGYYYVASVTIPKRPYLRPAADEVYPSLAGRIRKAHDKSGGGDE